MPGHDADYGPGLYWCHGHPQSMVTLPRGRPIRLSNTHALRSPKSAPGAYTGANFIGRSGRALKEILSISSSLGEPEVRANNHTHRTPFQPRDGPGRCKVSETPTNPNRQAAGAPQK